MPKVVTLMQAVGDIARKFTRLNDVWDELSYTFKQNGSSIIIKPTSQEVLDFLLRVIPKTTIESLTIRVNHICTLSPSLPRMLTKTNHLTTLDLSFNNIDSDTCVAIAYGLTKCKTLQHLNLSNNPIADGICSIMNVATKINLKILYVVNCKIDADSAVDIGQTLPFVKALEILDLSENNLDIVLDGWNQDVSESYEGFKAIDKGLQYNYTLKKVYLQKTLAFDGDGVYHLNCVQRLCNVENYSLTLQFLQISHQVGYLNNRYHVSNLMNILERELFIEKRKRISTMCIQRYGRLWSFNPLYSFARRRILEEYEKE